MSEDKEAKQVEKFEPDSIHPSNANPEPVQREKDEKGQLGGHPDFYHPDGHAPEKGWYGK